MTGFWILQDRDEVCFHYDGHIVFFEDGRDLLERFDESVPGIGGEVVSMRGPAALGIHTARPDQDVVG